MVRVYEAWYLITKDDLIRAATLKIETTSNNYYDIFKTVAQANGNNVKAERKVRAKKSMPKASFDTISSFLGAM